ncbi:MULTISPECIES: stage V sporulation protein AC [Aneurinibacillus]|jgi:stage V sporulation protein AC|uniref:Stage V sporulation protein AC n=1 Tax=Aneurinibacillus thermoaerophilus TaxID=143495 RepID=A0A1G7XNV2_ANETH|nr:MULTISPECIES: stage V sporulation protein AC [Aneurinibacillus]AMA73660.1 stage V sporulation protein AC [Aneurinibacillus sp. XH2]MED0675063.1 stage V sporulation protein AC [Aneurinibacillus thermoaerophilus]MED0679536.1 stage V sporulation protein AC [Aneurinibacillus thermoaerophilus]MED0737464.1 stage V sporulation protein AC [Aneurinibacillus thermoaerophilus]MED0756315.1 stage V sporulation protein AC [Aneurinibacillus thermoaerophilus]
MASSVKKWNQNRLMKAQQAYSERAAKYKPKPPYLANCVKAFWVGGAICAFGQLVSNFYIRFFNFTKETAGDPTVATLIFISVLLTGFGVYDKLGQYAGAGSAVPVTGFANSMSSAAIEHRAEGWVLGVGGNMFKLAGGVIVYGVVAALVVSLIKWLIIKV